MRFFGRLFWMFTRPREVFAGFRAAGLTEERLLVMVAFAALVNFALQAPWQLVIERQDGELARAEFGAFLVVSLFIIPLFLYGVAGLVQLACRLFGGQGSWPEGRLALFWAVLSSVMLMALLRLLLLPLGGPEVVENLLIGLYFLFVYGTGLYFMNWDGRRSGADA